MAPFLEISLEHGASLLEPSLDVFDTWNDDLDSTSHSFSSGFGRVRMRKRASFPATFAVRRGPVLCIGYGDQELALKIITQPLQDVPEELFYKGEFLVIIIDCMTRSIIIQRDALSTLPLFVGVEPSRTVISNSYACVYESLNPQKLVVNDSAIANMLAGNDEQETLFKNIHVLYDRMRAEWGNNGFVCDFPPDGSIQARANRHHGDAKQFFSQFERNLDTYWQRYGEGTISGLELSGGMDSTAIAGYYADSNHSFIATTLTYTGSFQQSVQTKLNDFTQRFGTTSHPIPMDPAHDYPLGHILQTDGAMPFYALEDIYTPSTKRIADYLHAHNATVVFRGVGGDELFENYPASSNTVEPAKRLPLLSRSISAAGLKASNVYIERGIWPVLPLADPELYMYCQSLPMRYRHGRDILRAYMHARGFPEGIHTPTVNEHFGVFFVEALATSLSPVFHNYMQRSVLADMGLLDTNHSLEAWDKAVQAKNQKDLYKLYLILCIEINLQHWRQRLA